MNCLRQTSASFMYAKFSAQTRMYWIHIPKVVTRIIMPLLTCSGLWQIFFNRTAITHVLRTRKGLEDYRVGSDSTAWATELWFYCHVHCWEKKRPSAVAGFHFHVWQPSVNDTTVSRPARKVICHLSRFTLTLMSRWSVAASEGQTLLSEIPIN